MAPRKKKSLTSPNIFYDEKRMNDQLVHSSSDDSDGKSSRLLMQTKRPFARFRRALIEPWVANLDVDCDEWFTLADMSHGPSFFSY